MQWGLARYCCCWTGPVLMQAQGVAVAGAVGDHLTARSTKMMLLRRRRWTGVWIWRALWQTVLCWVWQWTPWHVQPQLESWEAAAQLLEVVAGHEAVLGAARQVVVVVHAAVKLPCLQVWLRKATVAQARA